MMVATDPLWLDSDPSALAALDDDALSSILDAHSRREAWATWTPRPDAPADFDQQTAFVEARDLVSIAMGGNGSGKTAAAAKKCADFLLSTPPPRPDTPFWVIAENYTQVCSVCWGEKLWGGNGDCGGNAGFLPKWEIDWDRVVWLRPRLGWPLMVPLKPWPDGNNWMLEFKSYEQGREAMQARSIGGFWFSEQFPWGLFLEVLRGCREYMIPGGQFCEFTPIDPELCLAIEAIIDDPPDGWGFYRLNTERNRANLAAEWFQQFFDAVPDEMLATRQTGALATFEGVIFQGFNPAVHVTDDDSMVWLPGTTHHRAFDWGASVEHPFAGVWGCYDGIGDWLIYDEYWDISQDKITQDHAAAIMAQSIAWGWPAPEWFLTPTERQKPFVTDARRLVRELRPRWNGRADQWDIRGTGGVSYRDSFADPSRPGEINAFNQWGIVTMPAANEVYKGIDMVRGFLKSRPQTGMPRLRIHRRCKHLIEEVRKYRWTRQRPNQRWTTAAPRPVPLKKDDDTVDALRYLIASVERARGLRPSSAQSHVISQTRPEVHLDRGRSDRDRSGPAAVTAGRQGWFRK